LLQFLTLLPKRETQKQAKGKTRFPILAERKAGKLSWLRQLAEFSGSTLGKVEGQHNPCSDSSVGPLHSVVIDFLLPSDQRGFLTIAFFLGKCQKLLEITLQSCLAAVEHLQAHL
jgi:hypothetical protein